MIVTIIAFIIIFLCALPTGMALTKALYHKNNCKSLMTPDVYIVSGVMALTVYAQFVSLFIRVSLVAFVIMSVLVLLSFIYIVKGYSFTNFVTDIKKYAKNITFVHVVVMLFVFITCILWTCDVPKHYDTYLYHAQAIRWVEEYGVIKGLGNLHNRLAYNSAFMCFQALFSFSFIFNPSLHVANGFITLVFLMYAAITNNVVNKRKLKLSDLFKFVTVIYICTNAQYMSSCQTDDLALLLFAYIVTKWTEAYERNESNPHVYGYFCVLGVYAATVKISSISLVLLSAYPVYLFIKGKRYKDIALYVAGSLSVSLFWFVRSVIISGYLLYPYGAIDLFSVPWKMPKEVLKFDSDEITAWARGIYNVDSAHISIMKWLPMWFSEKDLSQKILIIVGFVSIFFIAGMLVAGIKTYIKNKNSVMINSELPKFSLYIYVIVALLFWLLSAPLYRYGCIFLMIPTVILFYEIQNRFADNKVISGFIALQLIFAVCTFGAKFSDKEHMYIKKAADYELLDCKEVTWEGMQIYCPSGSDQIGYQHFPAAISEETLNGLELIGKDIKSGIKHK